MPPESRQVLLLTALEGFRPEEAAVITDRSVEEVRDLVAAALAEIDRQIATRVLIIEDEPLISMDLAEITESLGHEVTTIARTAAQAVKAAGTDAPGLVLADIQLADGSSGLDAVRDILEHVRGAGDLHHLLPRTAADRQAARTYLPDHQALRSQRREGHDQPGALLPHHRFA